MPVRCLSHSSLCAVLAGAVLLALASPPARAQLLRPRQQGGPGCCPCPYPAVPGTPGAPGTTPETPATPETPTTPADVPNAIPELGGERAGATGGGTVALATPTMEGHQLGIPALAFGSPQLVASFPPNGGRPGNGLAPGTPGSGLSPNGFPRPFGSENTGAILVPTVRSFKISDNESPRPLDRAYFDFNYYDNVNSDVDRRLGVDLRDVRVYRESFGLEKTFLDGDASIGLRLPINTLSADSGIPQLNGTNTAAGDLTTIFKLVPWQDRETGNLFSVGLAVTAPTGPADFAGSPAVLTLHDTILQPFAGYVWNFDRFYVHGFLALDAPTDARDVVVLYNDFGVGYYLYRGRGGDRFITAIVPTLEVHVSNPLTHRGALNFADPSGTPDEVDLTMGTSFEMNGWSSLAVGLVTPVTGPKPFDYELLIQLNVRFGGDPGAGGRGGFRFLGG